MAMNISCKFEKASYNIFFVRAVTVKSLYTLRWRRRNEVKSIVSTGRYSVDTILMSLSRNRRYISWFYSAAELPPKSPHFVRVVHTTGRQPLIGHCFLTIENGRMTILQMLVTKKQPPLTLTHLW